MKPIRDEPWTPLDLWNVIFVVAIFVIVFGFPALFR